MRRFRTQWLALFGALVILSLSLSSAFGARPTSADGDTLTFGQQVSAFVHSLHSGEQDEEQDEDQEEECDTDEDSGEAPDDTDEDGAEGSEEDGADEDADERRGRHRILRHR